VALDGEETQAPDKDLSEKKKTMSEVLRESAISMLTAGISTRANARELNVQFSTISHLQRRIREFDSTSN
jgi:transposase